MKRYQDTWPYHGSSNLPLETRLRASAEFGVIVTTRRQLEILEAKRDNISLPLSAAQVKTKKNSSPLDRAHVASPSVRRFVRKLGN